MTTEFTMPTAGLIFQGLRELDIVKIGNRVSNAFEALEQNVTGVRILSTDSARISSSHHNVTVRVLEDQVIDGLPNPAPQLVELAIDGGCDDDSADVPRMDTVLAHALKSLHWTFSADQIKWVTPGAILSSADFVMATSQPDTPNPTPKPKVTLARNAAGIVERRYEFPNVDEANEVLNEQLTQKAVQALETGGQCKLYAAFLEDPQPENTADEDIREETAPLRLSVWMVTFTVSLFALPVGAALLVFNLLKGENLRLTAQAAALTGTFITLETHGATAQTFSVIQHLVG